MPFVMLPVDDEQVSLLVEASDDGSKTSNSGAADETEDPVLRFELASALSALLVAVGVVWIRCQ